MAQSEEMEGRGYLEREGRGANFKVGGVVLVYSSLWTGWPRRKRVAPFLFLSGFALCFRILSQKESRPHHHSQSQSLSLCQF